MKFGGSCISSIKNLEYFLREVELNLNKKPIIVVSALNGQTAELKEMAFELRPRRVRIDETEKEFRTSSERIEAAERRFNKFISYHRDYANALGIEDFLDHEIEKLNLEFINALKDTDTTFSRYRDAILSAGERYAARLIARFLTENDIKAVAHDSFNLGLVTDSNYGNATPELDSLKDIRKGIQELDKKITHVVTGFIAKDIQGNITTMGPNSSDDTAVLMAIAGNASEVWAYKTTDGILSAQPDLIRNPRRIPSLDYHEAYEIASSGADVMSATSIGLAHLKGKKLKVKSLKNPEIFTTISEESNKERKGIKAVVSKNNITIVRLESPYMVGRPGYAARVYEILAGHGISIDVISTSGVVISSTLDPHTNDRKRKDEEINFSRLERMLHGFGKFTITRENAVISLIGPGVIYDSSSIINRTMRMLNREKIPVRMDSLAEGSCNYRFVIDQKHEESAVRSLYHEFLTWDTASFK